MHGVPELSAHPPQPLACVSSTTLRRSSPALRSMASTLALTFFSCLACGRMAQRRVTLTWVGLCTLMWPVWPRWVRHA